MADDTTAQLQGLLNQLRDGDLEARMALLERAHARIRRLAGKVLGSFDDLNGRHELDSVVSDTWIRLLKTLESVRPATVKDFFRLSAHKIRQVMLDLVEKQRRLQAHQVSLFDGSRAEEYACSSSPDPTLLAQWTEFHQKVDTLTGDEKDVFDLHYYAGISQAETAKILDIPPRQVSRLWLAATAKLADGVIPEKTV